jgi:hypothetical protein
MIEDKKSGKTRRVSKKVKKMHEEAVSTGLLGSTQQKGGNAGDVYKIDIKRGDEVVKSDLKSDMDLLFISLRDVLDMLEKGVVRIEKSDFFGRNTKLYKFEKL